MKANMQSGNKTKKQLSTLTLLNTCYLNRIHKCTDVLKPTLSLS